MVFQIAMKVRGQKCETRVVQSLSTGEREDIRGWGEEQGAFGLIWRPMQRYLLRYVEGQLVAKAGVLELQLWLRGEGVQVGGVGGVITAPAHRKQGHATGLLKDVDDYLCSQVKVQYGMLFCREALIPFYNRLGWEPLAETITFQQPGGPVVCPFPTMILSCCKRPWPKGSVNLKSEPW